MKSGVLIGAVAIVILGGGAGFFLLRKSAPQPMLAHVEFVGPRPTSTNSDPAEVFQRAFWKRPSPTDKILHAERREWSDAEGLKKWQWFLVVEPSAELVKYLREENAFDLVSSQSVTKVENPPVWFTPPAVGGADILRAPTDHMQLVFSKTKPLLYATDTGQGFASGAREKLPEKSENPIPAGRLPTTPPPNHR